LHRLLHGTAAGPHSTSLRDRDAEWRCGVERGEYASAASVGSRCRSVGSPVGSRIFAGRRQLAQLAHASGTGRPEKGSAPSVVSRLSRLGQLVGTCRDTGGHLEPTGERSAAGSRVSWFSGEGLGAERDGSKALRLWHDRLRDERSETSPEFILQMVREVRRNRRCDLIDTSLRPSPREHLGRECDRSGSRRG
jgi:hypothetical protein